MPCDNLLGLKTGFSNTVCMRNAETIRKFSATTAKRVNYVIQTAPGFPQSYPSTEAALALNCSFTPSSVTSLLQTQRTSTVPA
jgi:hypothetical protein